VYRAAAGLPGVVRGARAKLALVHHNTRIAADFLRALGVTKQVRVVSLLPHEDEVHGGHVIRDERATGGRTRERVGRDAEPAGVVLAGVVGPELFFFGELGLLVEEDASLRS
jgi:hypothetical protein